MNKSPLLRIEVGDIPLLIEFNNPDVFEKVRAPCEPFTTQRDFIYKIQVRADTDRKKNLNSKNISLCVVDNIYKVESEEFKGHLDLTEKRGRIDIFSSWEGEAFINALRNICIFLVVNTGGIVLHASGIVRDNKAYIFFGPSGSGKSTVARLSLNYTVLSDDLIGIKSMGRSWRAFPIPYNINFSCRLNDYFKIAGFFKLMKDKNNYIKALPKSKALADFFILPYGFEGLVTPSDYLNRYYRLIEQFPFSELHFLRDSSFWECIDGYVN